jgi:hypothetical protein
METMMGQLPLFGAGAAGGGPGGGGRSMMMSGMMNRSSGMLGGEPVARDEDDGEGEESRHSQMLQSVEEMTSAQHHNDPAEEWKGGAASSAPSVVAIVAPTAYSILGGSSSNAAAESSVSAAEPEFDENKAEGDKYLAAAEVDKYGVPKIELYCMCQQPWNPNRFMVACDGCDEWYHDSCLGIPQEELEKVDKFMCQWCVEREKRKDARRKQHEADKAAKTAARKARQAQRRREQQSAAKRARTKPCRNTTCTQRARPQSKYCSEECGLEVAGALHHEREVKRLHDAVQGAIAQQGNDLRQWMESHPNYLLECSPSVATTKDLEVILATMSELDEVKEQLALAEGDVDDQTARAKVQEMRKAASVVTGVSGIAQVAVTASCSPVVSQAAATEAEHRLDCAVCGKDVPTTSYVGHLRECMHRNDEFAHSTVTQNPSLCNLLSRRTNRYCSMPKGQCSFHSPGSQIDYQLLLCGFNDCATPALQCLKHADWRESKVKVARLAVRAMQERLAALEERVALAKQRIASREMSIERGNVKVLDERRK